MKALLLAPFSPEALSRLGERIPLLYEPWTETRRLWDPRDLARRLREEGITILVVEADFLFGEVFEEGTPLKFVGVCRDGVNQVDLEAATLRGIPVVNTPGRTAQGVAELTLALMLALVRRLPEAQEYVRGGRWRDPAEPYLSLRGVELAGKTLGVIGLGKIGRRVARLARALGMQVLAYDPYAPPLQGVERVPLEDLLRRSDVVSLHAPETEETRGLLSAERLALMKPGAFLINTASPGLVDPAALAEALESGRLAGAGLDVHESHPLPPTSPLLHQERALLTPHIGGATAETVERHSAMMAQDILRFLAGRRPRNLVNPQVWWRP